MVDLKAEDICWLWSSRGNKNYEYNGCFSRGCFGYVVRFRDSLKNREVCGKVVREAREGEAFHWPNLAHVNLLPLINVINLTDDSQIFISPWYENTLYELINRNDFYADSRAFNNKKSFIEDILWGLDHIHKKKLCLVNLHEENVLICQKTNKAAIGNFSCLLPLGKVDSKTYMDGGWYIPPEVVQNHGTNEDIDGMAADIWSCGVMILSVFCGPFTSRFLANSCTFEKVMSTDQRLRCFVSQKILAKANPGSVVTDGDSVSFKCFLYLLLANDPRCRTSADCAALDYFLRDTSVKSVAARFESNIKGKLAYTTHCDCFQQDDTTDLIHRGSRIVRSATFRKNTIHSASDTEVSIKQKLDNPHNGLADLKMDDTPAGDASFDVTSNDMPTIETLIQEIEASKVQNFGFHSMNTSGYNVLTGNDREVDSEISPRAEEISSEEVVQKRPLEQPINNLNLYLEMQYHEAKQSDPEGNTSTGFLNSSLDHNDGDAKCVHNENYLQSKVINDEEAKSSHDNYEKETEYSDEERAFTNDAATNELRDSTITPDSKDIVVESSNQPEDSVEVILEVQRFVSKEHLPSLEIQVTGESVLPLKRSDSYAEAIDNGMINHLPCSTHRSISESSLVEVYSNPQFSISSLSMDKNVFPDYECSNSNKMPAKVQFNASTKCPKKRRFWRRWNKFTIGKKREGGNLRKTDPSPLGNSCYSVERDARKIKGILGKKKIPDVEQVDVVIDLPEEIDSIVPCDSPESLLLNLSFENSTFKEKRRRLRRLFVFCQ